MPKQTHSLQYDTQDFKPIRIRAYLQTGVISDQFLPLDAVIYYQYVRNILGPQEVTIPGSYAPDVPDDIKLPFLIKSGPSPNMWYYACSFAQWPDSVVESKQFYVKKFRLEYSDLVDFKGRRRKVATSRGRYKNYHLWAYYRHALYVNWYAIGDSDAIWNCLRFCTHLGKKTSQGWGAVKMWEITDWPEDWSIKNGKGLLTRALPSNRGDGFIYGIRPSYWLRKHQFPCIMP